MKTELTPDNYPVIQGLMMGLAQKRKQETGVSLAEAYPEALKEAADFMKVTSEELEGYLNNNRQQYRVVHRAEHKLLIKSEDIDSNKEQRKVLEDLLVKELTPVPPGMGKRLVFTSAAVADDARLLLRCVTRNIWNGVLQGKRLQYFRCKQTGKILEVWRLA